MVSLRVFKYITLRVSVRYRTALIESILASILSSLFSIDLVSQPKHDLINKQNIKIAINELSGSLYTTSDIFHLSFTPSDNKRTHEHWQFRFLVEVLLLQTELFAPHSSVMYPPCIMRH